MCKYRIPGNISEKKKLKLKLITVQGLSSVVAIDKYLCLYQCLETKPINW